MNHKKIDGMADKIAEEISNVLADVMKPVFENLTKEIHALAAGLEDRQKENMRSMADAFLQQMAKTADRMFESITADTADICRL